MTCTVDSDSDFHVRSDDFISACYDLGGLIDVIYEVTDTFLLRKNINTGFLFLFFEGEGGHIGLGELFETVLDYNFCWTRPVHAIFGH